MKNHPQKRADKSKRALVIWAFLVLLGVIFNLTCTDAATAGVGNDLNGDGRTDLLWRNSKNGSTAIWFLNGATIGSAGFPGGVPLAWQIAGIGDVNGDGKADVIWRHSTSATVAIWLMNGTAITSVGFPASVPTAWSLEAVGDVNGDGKADLVWRNSNDGNTAIWLMNGTKIATSGFLGKVPLPWQLAGAGDVDADGKADLIWRNGTSDAVAIWVMDGLTRTSSGFPGNASPDLQIAGIGDVDGDSKAVPTTGSPRNQQQVVLVLEYTRNGLLFCLKFTADRTNPNLFPPPITSPTFFILAENGSVQSEQLNTSLNGIIFQPTVGVRGRSLTLSRVLLSGFNGTTYTSSRMELLDAATGKQGFFLGTVQATRPSISAWPFMLAFINFINGSSLGFGFSRETQTNTVFYLNTDEQNSLVQVPIGAHQWWYTLRQ